MHALFSSAAPLQQQCIPSTGYGGCSLQALDHTWTREPLHRGGGGVKLAALVQRGEGWLDGYITTAELGD